MKLETIIFCEDIIELPSTTPGVFKSAVVNPTASFGLEIIPSTFSFSVLIMLKGLPTENVEISVNLFNPRTNRPLFEASATLTPDIPVNPSTPKDLAGINLNIPLKNVVVEDAGEYIIKVKSNSNDLGEKTIHFMKVS